MGPAPPGSHSGTTRTAHTRLNTEVGLIYDAIHVLAEVLHNASKDGADFKFNAVECDNGTFLEDGQKLLDTFKGTTYDGFTGEIQFDEDGMREVDSLTLWQLHKGRSEHVATWSPEKGLDFVHDPHDDDGVPGSEDVDDTIDENSLENRTIIVTTVVSPPFVMLKDGSEQYEGNQRFEGFCVSLLDKLAEVLHFDYKLQLVKPEKFGYEVSPGRWTGLIGELVEGKVDMAAAPLTMTSKRSTVVEFTVPFMTLGIGLMASRQDETLVHSFLSPFSAATWCYLVLSLLAAMALLTLIGRLSPFEWDQVSETRVDSEYTLGNAFWFLFSGFTFQRVTITPRAPSTVVAFISWWIFSLIVMVAYASVLGEFIIRYRDRPTLNSVDDLLKQKDIKYGTYRRGSTQSFFQKSTFPKYMELWQGMQSQGDEAFVDNYYEGIERVIGGNYAMFLESPVLEYLENRYCEIEQVGDIMGSGGYALALPKGSPYQSELSAAITRLKFDGTLQLLRQYWWEDHNVANCPPEEHVYRPTPFTVRFGRLSLVFIFLLLGLLITMVIMLVIFVRGHSKRDVTAEAPSTVVAFISWWIFSLIVMVAYASVLGEFIIRYRDRPTLNSVDDLLKQKDIKYGTYRRGSTQSFFQKSTFPKYMELWQGMQSQGDEAFVDNYYEGIERVIGGNYAMFLESPVLEYLENRYCEIEQVGDIMGSGGYALALPKGSPYQSELSAAITRLKFDGTLQLLRQYWWEDHNVANCPPEEHVYRPTPFTVRFGRLSLVFIFLLLGLLITMVIMLVIFVRGHSKRDVTAESMSTIWNTLLEELRSAMMCRKERKPQEATKDGEITPPSPPPVTVSPA
ncbi:glutamate receptor ionotropic, kainate 2 [Ixodes scapularis]